jgi:PiT family inorganic phosphate transporter
MLAVGEGVMRLDGFTAFVAVGSMSASVHMFAVIGVPVSTSQAIIGALLGIGMIRGVQVLRLRTLGHIAIGWLLTPAVALVLAAAGYAIFIAGPAASGG